MSDWLTGEPMDPAATPIEPMPALPGIPFLHAGAGAVIVGPTGRGRSSLIQVCLYDAAMAGQRCAYLGCEVTAEEFNARAAALAAIRGHRIDDTLRSRLANVRYLELASVITKAWDLEASKPQDDEFIAKMNTPAGEQPPAQKQRSPWADLISTRYQVVAIDPISAVAATLNLDFDKSNAEFIRFYDRLIQPLTAHGVAVLMIDNVGHAEEAKARAKGASAKQDKPDLTFSCSLSATPAGLILKAAKVRSIRAPHQRGDEWLFAKDTQRLIRRESAESQQTTFRPTHIMEKISKELEQHEGLSKKAIRTAIGGRANNVDLALELLISENYIEVREDGQAHRHHSIKPFRESTVSTVSAPCPNGVPDTDTATVSHRVPLSVGEGPVTGHGSEPTQNDNRVPDTDIARAEALAAEHTLIAQPQDEPCRHCGGTLIDDGTCCHCGHEVPAI